MPFEPMEAFAELSAVLGMLIAAWKLWKRFKTGR